MVRSGTRVARRDHPTRRRWGTVLVIAGVLALPACQATEPPPVAAEAPTPTTSSPSPEPVPPVVLRTDPPLGAVDVSPATPLVVRAGNGQLAGVTVTAADGTPLAGEVDVAGTAWVAAAPLAYGTAYTVRASARGPAGRAAQLDGTVSTVQPRTLTMPTVFPGADSVVGVGQPVSVTFDEDVTDRAAVERALTVTSTPPVVGAWSWIDDRTVHFRPQEYWPPNTHVAVDVRLFGLHVGGGVHGEADRHVEFDVGQKKVAVVDARELVLRVYVDDQLVREMPTSLGKRSTPTPSGTYVVMQQSRNYTMDSSTYGVGVEEAGGYRTEVQYASRLSNSGIFVHGAPWSVGDQGRRNVSHGCLNLSVANAGWFFENVGRGDVVQVVGAGGTLETWDGFGAWNATWDEWLAGSALPRPAGA